MPFLEVLQIINAVLVKAYSALPDPQLHFKLNLRWKTVVAKSAWVKPCCRSHNIAYLAAFHFRLTG